MTALVEVKNLKKYFPVSAGLFRGGSAVIKAVDDISFHIDEGTTMGLVGESGCGKTTAGKNLLLLQQPTEGEIYFVGQDLVKLDKKKIRSMRYRMGIVYQNPHSSLNPRMVVSNVIGRPLALQGIGDANQRMEIITEMIEKVGLNPEHLGRYPHEFSGGQKQRIAVARAIITNPDFVVLDEPTSALDVSVQAQILKLLKTLQDELNLTYLFISHDISVVRHMSDTVGVMYVGKLVEWAEKIMLFENPLHPYTQALLSVVPIPDPRMSDRAREILAGDIPSPQSPPSGCRFHPRCKLAFDKCKIEEPEMIEISKGHFVACHLHTKV
jgi:oligopeptide transport system ATP-binding protein